MQVNISICSGKSYEKCTYPYLYVKEICFYVRKTLIKKTTYVRHLLVLLSMGEMIKIIKYGISSIIIMTNYLSIS